MLEKRKSLKDKLREQNTQKTDGPVKKIIKRLTKSKN